MKILRKLFGPRHETPPAELDCGTLEEELDHWSIVTADNQESGESAVLRLRTSRPSSLGIDSFSDAISINWRFESDTGMPPPEVKEAMDAFEDAVDPLTWLNGFSELMYVATGGGHREWVFYSSDRGRFMAELNGLLSGHEPYPLEIELYDDPEWRLWRDISEAVEERECAADPEEVGPE